MDKAKRLFISMLTLLCCSTGAWALDRDTENYYILSSLQDWQDFASLAQTVPNINARMIADIDLGSDQTMIGSESVPYEGIFDGQGHKLTVAYSQAGITDGIGPFHAIGAATIQNLHVDGSMLTNCGIGGIAGIIAGNATIQKCWVSASMQSVGSKYTGTIGGFCSWCAAANCHLTIEDCLFDGVIVNDAYCGGFMSHVEQSSSSVTMRRGLNVGTYPTTTYENGTFVREVLSGVRNLETSTLFYKKVFKIAQGTQVTDDQLADGSITTTLQNDRAETVWVQDATSGQPRLDVFNHPVTTYDAYVHPTSQIINLSELTEDYIAQDGDVLTGTTGYSVQIAAGATITLSDVTITNYRKSPIECLGNATIYIEDGSVNRIKDTDDSQSYGRPALAFGPSGTTLTINGNTGRLIANGGKFSPGIGCRAYSGSYGGLIINGGVISAYGNTSYTNGIGAVGADDSHGPSCGDITINGGTINASASDGIGIGAGGPNSCGAITINGGTITSSAVRGFAIGGNCSKVVINGGDINASTTTSVGIGSSGVVYIEGGTIVASASGSEGVGISGDKGVLIRSSITSLTASKGPYGANAIQGGTVYISENLNDVTEGNTRTLTPKASFDPEADIEQDGEGYYLIGSLQNWKEFAVLSQIEASPKAKMVADINLGDDQSKIATFEGGIFDGQGHTITINLSTTVQYVGLFCDIIDATIKNLHVAGSINTTKRFVGGMVGRVYSGTSTIQNCWSSVNVTTTYSGDGVQGGMIGCVNGTLNISDCLYDGALNGSSAYTWGGFVGWLYGTTNISNCLFASDEMNVGSSYTATHVAGGGNITNCYYKNVMGTAQGTQATAAELADGTIAYKLQNHRGDLVWGQRIGTDTEPVLTNDENYRVYRSKNGGYTNDPEEAYEDIQQDEEGNYLIGSVQNWQDFATLVQTTPTANAKMTADIDLGDDQTKIGSYATRYSGIFDGQGHTLTFNYNTSSMSVESGQSYLGAAPFRDIEGATIRNLHTAGRITADKIGASGLVGWAYGTNTLEKCWSDVNLVSSNNTADTFTGFVAFMYGTNLTITDCVYTGLIQSTSKISHAGFIGYHTYGTATLTNCLLILDDGSDVNTTDNVALIFYTFDRLGYGYSPVANFSNCFYKEAFGISQGTHATSAQLADGTIATALQNERAEEVWVQDPVTNQPMLKLFATKAYTVPASGIGTFSAKAKFTVPDGLTAHYCKTYNSANGTIGVVNIDDAVPANTGVLLKGTPGETYTLTGTNNEAATVTGNALVAVTEATHVNQVSGDYTNFMMSGGKFIKIEASDDPNVKMPANRAYLQILTSDLPSSLARGITLSWDDDATSISEMEKWRNGENEKFYDLQGRLIVNGKLSNGRLPKGLYINNGHKVVIK